MYGYMDVSVHAFGNEWLPLTRNQINVPSAGDILVVGDRQLNCLINA